MFLKVNLELFLSNCYSLNLFCSVINDLILFLFLQFSRFKQIYKQIPCCFDIKLVYSGFCKTSYHLLISPPPTNLPSPKYVDVHTGANKINRQGRQYTCYFPANGSTNLDIFQPKFFLISRGIIPQNFSSLGFGVSEELGNKQTHSLPH